MGRAAQHETHAATPSEIERLARLRETAQHPGRLPQVIGDVAEDERAARVPVASEHGIGAYVSVPLRFSDGELYGAAFLGVIDEYRRVS